MGGLDLSALRDGNTIAVLYGGLNATSRLNGEPTILAATLREHLKEWKAAEGLGTSPLATPSLPLHIPSSANPVAGRGIFPAAAHGSA